jgi:class 3 adenylate cyclase
VKHGDRRERQALARALNAAETAEGRAITFAEILDQAIAMLRQRGRLTYRTLQRQLQLDDAALDDLKDELIYGQRLAADEDGRVLVWTGGPAVPPRTTTPAPQAEPLPTPEAERRQLTVLFCDLVGSTALSEQLDPEDLREVVRAYHQVSAAVIGRFEGHTAQYLGDGLLVYFGYPVAHEDNAQRAVRTALGIVEAVQRLSFPTIALPRPLQVRLGIHTGVVVVGAVGSSAKHEILALGDTPNLAARLQGVAAPETVVISAASARLVQGFFALRRLGPQTLHGSSTPMEVYQVLAASGKQSRFEVAVGTGLTPFVGREEERGLLQRRWAQATAGAGQVVLLSGEPGIGKSRLVQTLQEHASADGATCIAFHCAAYHQNSAFYPIIAHVQRLLQFAPHEAPHAKLTKLTQWLAACRFPQAETLPLLAAWLTLPQPEGAPPLTLSPRKQKQKTQEALVAWLMEEAERSPVYCVWRTCTGPIPPRWTSSRSSSSRSPPPVCSRCSPVAPILPRRGHRALISHSSRSSA